MQVRPAGGAVSASYANLRDMKLITTQMKIEFNNFLAVLILSRKHIVDSEPIHFYARFDTWNPPYFTFRFILTRYRVFRSIVRWSDIHRVAVLSSYFDFIGRARLQREIVANHGVTTGSSDCRGVGVEDIAGRLGVVTGNSVHQLELVEI